MTRMKILLPEDQQMHDADTKMREAVQALYEARKLASAAGYGSEVTSALVSALREATYALRTATDR